MEVMTRTEDWNPVNLPEKHDGTKASKSTSDGKVKRKAPAIPVVEDKNATAGVSSINDNQSQRKPNGLNQSSRSSTTWSTTSSSEYSPSSNSFSSSSLSDGTPTTRKPELTIQRVGTKSKGDVNIENEQLEKPQNYNPAVVEKGNEQTGAKPSVTDSNVAGVNQDLVGPKVDQEGVNCSSLSDYVENAISNSNILSSSPSRSDEGTEQPPPPRLLSFESSSNLHQDGSLKLAPDNASAVKLDYVSLDFVRSAAAVERRGKKDKDDDESTARSNSSLSSSIISSIDSEDGSTIGSDVVENLYNKITAAAVRHSSKSSLQHLGPEQQTGDIEKDLYPLIFPGRRRNSADNVGGGTGNFDFIRPPSQSVTSPAEKVESFLRQNLNNNNNNSQRVTDKSTPLAESVGDHALENKSDLKTQEYSICSNCSKVLYDSESEMNDAIHKARDILGRCMCNSDEVYDPIIEIDYCNSNLKEVPSDIWDHAHTLIKLLMESNTITELPKELFTCQNLQYLSVSDNDIGVLPPCLASLVNLQHLDVSKNVIEDVPECIRCCKNLQVLDASVNPVERLSEGFTQLISLRELYMNDCFFDFLPANFGRMSQLVVLELRDNQLQILPKSMRRLTQLSRLDLGGNVFQEWPDVIGELRNLSELWLDCNELSKVPPAIGSLTKLTYLDLSRNYLETFPSQIGSLDKLKDLLLSENSLASIPDTIGFLKDLVICNLESNQLTSVPETFGKLASLEELDLSHNKIEQLPSSVGKLKSLQTLLLDDNQLTELPVEVGSCLSLKIFQISRNQIEELPESIGNLTDLRVLNLTQNKLPYLPISMIKLARLNALWITPNQSKPNVPLHAELHQESGKRILTNILFPQKDKGFAQGTKLLSILDDDDDNYANDAADDDDPVQYAQRPRGITHVVFNLDATTYSTDALHMAENFVKNNEEQEPENSSDKPTSQTTEIPAPVIEVDIKPAPKAALESDDFSVIVSDNFKPTGLSVLGPPSGGENDKPTMKTANILKVKPSTEVTSTKPAAKLIEEAGNMRSTTSKTVKADDLSADEDNLPPTSPQGIRAWTSHSHLPALSTLRAKEELAAKEGLSKSEIDLLDSVADTPMHQSKQSGGSVTDIAAAKSGTSKSNDELKAIFEKRPAEPSSFNNASNLLDRLDQLANRNRGGTQATAGRTMPADVTTGKELHAPSSGAVIAGKEVHLTQGRKSRDSKKPVAAALDSIPFMDEADEDLKVAGDRESDDGALDQTLQEFSIDKEATKAVSEELSTKREQLASAENNYALSADFVTEGKSSSVTSGESLPATDHDSGVGNDVESQESIPDDGNEVTGALHKNAMHLARKPTFDTNTTQVGESTALRRNKGGWIALVRTDQPQAEPTSSGITSNDQVFAAAPSPSVTSQAQRNKAAEKRSNQLHFAPNITVDSTTVTYSFDYNNARQPGQVSPNKASAGNNNNKVTENIKKFEKFFEGGYPGPRRASADLTGMKTSKSLNQLQEIQSPQNVARKPPPPVKPKALSQPKTLSLQNIPPAPPSGGTPKPNMVSFSTERRVSDNTREESQVDVSHADTSLENEMSEVDRTLEQLSLRRLAGHQKKSKFEEALAATKHKHFRDKLEKMMQQKAPLTPGRRPSRNSTSPLANIPRITSPVPMALSPHGKFTPLENLTAEDTWSNGQKDPSRPVERSSQQSVHERLKEKLQPKTIEPNSSQSATSRARQSSASTSRPFGRRGSTHRSSIRSLGGNETDDKEDSQDAESKKTIEEQLGQLLLDGTSSPGHKNDQGFVTYVPTEEMYNERRMQSPPPVSRSVGAFGQATRKPPPPSDWKDQLLRHIERKKQEKFEVNGLHPHLHPQQPMRVTSPSRHIEAGYTASASSASSSTHGDTNYSKVDNRNFPRNNEARRSFNRPSEVARKPEGQNRAMSRSVTAPEAIGSIPQPGGKRESLTQPSNFVRSSNDGPRQPAGRRSSGRFLRTRTPGPESVASSGKHVESIVRPKSAMDMPTNSFQMSGFDKTNDMPSQIQKPRALPAVAPPTYEAHMLRRKPPSNGSKKNYESDYVNVEYVDQMRASGRRKEKRDKTQPNKEHVEQDPQSAFPLRASGSHESVLNSKMEKTNPYEAAMPNPAMMRGSNSQDSMLDKTYPKHYSLPAHSQPPTHHGRRGNGAANVPVARAPYPYEPINYQPPRQSSRSQGHKPVQKHPDKHSGQYGFIPAPSKTRPPKIPPRDHPVHVSKKHRQPHDDYMVLPDRRFPVDPYYLPPPPAFHDDYQETMPPLSPSLQRSYGEREDESVASAFRPYHQHQLNQRHSQAPAPKHNPYQQHYPQQQPPQPQHYDVRYNNQRGNVIDHHRHHHQLDRGAKQEFQYGYHENPPHQYHPTMEEDLSAGSEPSLSGEISRHWREADAAAELVTVTVMKNPTFGFHIMGGIDSGGNPYRPDDDGVFITYVAPGGAADGQVQPGDKILLVNGSDFVGITHKRAVDLLRNAGQVAVLVVERLVGRPV